MLVGIALPIGKRFTFPYGDAPADKPSILEELWTRKAGYAMNVFELRERLINDYSSYIRSFIRILDRRIEGLISSYLDEGLLWPDPLI